MQPSPTPRHGSLDRVCIILLNLMWTLEAFESSLRRKESTMTLAPACTHKNTPIVRCAILWARADLNADYHLCGYILDHCWSPTGTGSRSCQALMSVGIAVKTWSCQGSLLPSLLLSHHTIRLKSSTFYSHWFTLMHSLTPLFLHFSVKPFIPVTTVSISPQCDYCYPIKWNLSLPNVHSFTHMHHTSLSLWYGVVFFVCTPFRNKKKTPHFFLPFKHNVCHLVLKSHHIVQ